MVADESKGCLYISDRYGGKNDGQDQPGLFVVCHNGVYKRIATDMTPGGLSLLQDSRLMMVCEHNKLDRCLRFYTFSSVRVVCRFLRITYSYTSLNLNEN